ncbi:MAG: hypothetical protein K2L32_04800 [Muribaculaceae bacterium]|nr:hypothetical protein [Muribaculaceae bacterium]
MLKTLLPAAALLTFTSVAVASTPREAHVDSLKRTHKIISIGDSGQEVDSAARRAMIDNFYVDQFRQFEDPSAPYFMFMSRDARLAMGMGGTVRLRGWFDWGGTMNGAAFKPYLIQMHPDPAHIRQLDADPAGSNLFFRMIGHHRRIGTYQLYVEAEFSGGSSFDLALKKAYATIGDWTVGYASTSFSDPQALPPSVDAQGPNNKMDATSVLIRYMHTFKPGIVIAASVENPLKQTSITDEFSEATSTWAPDLGFFVQYQWGVNNMQHVRLSAVTRQLTYRDLVRKDNVNKVGWGLQLSSVVNISRPLTLYATVNGGRGMAGLGGDWLMNNFDMVQTPGRPGELYAPGVFGYMAALQYHIRRDLFAVATWGQAHYFQKKGTPADDYKYGLYGAVNLFYNLTPRLQFGLGFNVGKRVNYGGESRWARRLCAVGAFSF